MPPEPSDRLWGHMRRASSFGPAPLVLGRQTPWLLTGRPTDPEVQPVCRLGQKIGQPPAHAPTQASRQRENTAHNVVRSKQRDACSPRVDTSARSGPCGERHLPLSRHAPRQLSTRAERKNPPKWQPDREWRACPTRKSEVEAAAPPAVPLRGFSSNVVEHCAHLYAEREEARSSAGGFHIDKADHQSDHQRDLFPCGEPQSFRVTSGGWAADWTPPPPPAPSAHPETQAAWALDEEVAQWTIRGAARARPRGTLAVVDAFLRGPVADEMLPTALQDY